jgi:chromosome segregation ATPase
MDSPKFTKSDSTVLLLNEIDILLAQTRLLELYLKQSQATAANETARIPALQNELSEKQRVLESRDAELQNTKAETVILRERVAELEMVHQQAQAVAQEFAINRQDLQVELAALRHELEKNQQDFERQQVISRALQEGLEEQLAKLQDQLTERQSSSQGVATELQQAIFEIAALQRQVAELRAGRQEAQAIAAQELEQTRVRFEAELFSLQTALAMRDRALQENESAIAELERSLKTDILTLRSQLEQKQELVEFRDDELRDAQGQLAALQQRIIELESADRSAVANAEEIERIRRSFEDELTALQREVATREELAIRERQEAVAAVELALHSKIQALQQEQTSSLSAIDERETELHSAHAEAAALRERISQLEAATAADLTTRQLGEEARRSLEAELKSLHASLAQKEYALKEQQNFLRSVEDRLGGEINQLRGDLTQQRAAGESSNAEFERLRSEVTELQERNNQAELARHQLEEDRQHAAAHGQELEARLQAKEDEFRAAQAIAQEQKEAALRQQERQFRSVEDRLSSELSQLRSDLAQQRTASESSNSELERLRSETTALQEQTAQSDLSRRQLEENWQHAAAHGQELEARLQAKEDEFHVAQAIAHKQKEAALKEQEAELRSAADQLTAEIGQLRGQLEEQQRLSREENAELTRLRSGFSELQEQSRQSELSRRQLEENWQRAVASEQELRGTLRGKDDELRDAHGQLAALQQRIIELESTHQSAAVNAEEIERIRRSFDDELTALQREVATREELAIRERQEAVSAVELALHSKIQALQQEQSRSLGAIDERENELRSARTEAGELRERISQLEAAAAADLTARQLGEETRRSLEAELTSFHATLAQTEAALKEQENFFRSAEERLGGEINLLRGELAQRQAASESSDAELERLRSQIAELQERNAQTDHTRRQLEQNWQRAEADRRELEGRLHAKEGEFHAAQAIAQEQKEAALGEQERQLRSVEAQLSAEIARLHGQLEDRQKLSDQENATLVQLRSQIADLHERNEHSELSRRQLEENWQRVLASEQELRTSLRAKEDELHSVQAKGDEFKPQFEAAINQLQFQLTEKGLLAESRAAEIGNLKAEVNRLSEQLAQREFGETEAQVNFQREIESSLAAHQAEMAALHEEYRGKQHNLENELAQERQNAAALRNQIHERARLVDEAQRASRIREQDFEATATEAAALRARLHELETSNQIENAAAKTAADQALNRLQTELISLRSDLQQKAWALAQQQATMENVALAHKSQIQKLEAKLAEQQHGVKDRSLELEKAQSESRALHRRIEELDTELQHAQLTALSRTEQVTQDYAARIADLNSQLAQKTSVLQERDLAQANIEHTLRYELERLIREAEERNQILQNRNDELVRVKVEMDSLQERFAQLELSTSQTESALAGETERMHTELQARLALLQAELSQKEWALEERDATARGLEQLYLEEIESLRKQLAEKEAAIKPDGHDYVLGEPRLNQSEEERFQVTDSARSDDHHAHQTPQSRRWHTGFAWKRRWKS